MHSFISLRSWTDAHRPRDNSLLCLESIPLTVEEVCVRQSNHRRCSESLLLVTVMCYQPVGKEFAPGHGLQTCKIRFSETFRCAMKLRSNMPYWPPYSNWGVDLFHILLWSIASLYISLARVFEFNIDPLFTYTDLSIKDIKFSVFVSIGWFCISLKGKKIFHRPLELKIRSNL